MKNFLKHLCRCWAWGILLFPMAGKSQNNAIFFGGAGDGNNYAAYLQPSNNILYQGNTGDGWNFSSYLQPSNDVLYQGNTGDGWNFSSYAQASNSTLFRGGDGDGHHLNSYAQSSNLTLYRGGGGDGWASTYTPLGPLPVELLRFEASKQGSSVLLEWASSREINSSHYEVERSPDAVNFTFLNRVKSLNREEGADYALIDHAPMTGFNYYRIKMVDLDGKWKYTPTRQVIFEGAASLDAVQIYPNPAQGLLFASIPMLRNDEPMVINVCNTQGQIVFQQKARSVQQIIRIDVSSFARGTYFIQIKSESMQKIEKIVLH